MARGKQAIIRVAGDCASPPAGGGWVRFDLDIPPPGGAVRAAFEVADALARLADIVPAARLLATRVACSVLDDLHSQGRDVPCRKGCSACCKYLIPLSVPEAFALRDEIRAMSPQRHDRIMASCLKAARKVLGVHPPELNDCGDSPAAGQPIAEVSRWYASLGLTCPFLADGLCTIYSRRPIACREHMVTCAPELCGAGQQDRRVGSVTMPVSVAEALMTLAAELEGTDPQTLILPLAPLWASENAERSRRTWPAREMVERFANILHRTGDGERLTRSSAA